MNNKINIPKDDQLVKKMARTAEWYDSIWQSVGKCVFCDLKDKYIIHEENGVVLTINIYPYADGHLMAIPRRHVTSPKDLTQLEWETMRKFTYIARKLMKKAHGEKKMWTLIREGGPEAQMTVTDHIHMQLIPFVKKDLCKWNYDELKYTPLENVEIYKKITKEFVKADIKFEKKYKISNALPIVCDAIIKNSEGKILIEKRKKEFAINNDVLVLPGGHIDDMTISLEENLVNEIKQETNVSIDSKKLKIVQSGISEIDMVTTAKFLKARYKKPHTFIWNTYYYTEAIQSKEGIKPSDDCEEILWLSIDEIMNHEKINKEVKERIKKR